MRPNEKKERKKKKELASQVFHLFFGSIFRTEQTLALYLPTRVTARSISGSHVSPTIDQAFYVFFFFSFITFPFSRSLCAIIATSIQRRWERSCSQNIATYVYTNIRNCNDKLDLDNRGKSVDPCRVVCRENKEAR